MGNNVGCYYIGLDIGTNSVGWAVTDQDYNILKLKGKSAWGIHLFDPGNTAEERRMKRTSRRRVERRKQRIKLLRELFDKEICSVDPNFFARLDESSLHNEDRTSGEKYTLFGDPYLDKKYYANYPTIYHLRKELMETQSKPDIRLLYLAIHNIIKYRGHFLFEGIGEGEIPIFQEVLLETLQMAKEFGIELEATDVKEIERILTDKYLGVREKGTLLVKLFEAEEKNEKAFAEMLAGKKVSMGALFSDDIDDEGSEAENLSIDFKSAGFEEKEDEYADILGTERMTFLKSMKSIYDWSILTKILVGSKSLSDMMVKRYEQHRSDLKGLKKAVKENCDKNEYRKMFNSDSPIGYNAYIGQYKNSSVKQCSQEDICKQIKKLLCIEDKETGESRWKVGISEDMQKRVTNGTFLPKQTTKDNSLIPNVLHRKELEQILKNAERFYPFLSEKDMDGFSTSEKILKTQRFRIPYYVGPLNKSSERAWFVRKSDGAINPWNFEERVNLDESAEVFINNLTNECSYLIGEEVLPKNSIVYQRFELLNEINKIRIDGTHIPVEVKNDIVQGLFEKAPSVKKVTKKDIMAYLQKRCMCSGNEVITGIDDPVKSGSRSLIQLRAIIGDKTKDREMCERIIRIITVFGDEPKRLKLRLEKEFSDKLTKEEISKLAGLKLKGWGNLSKKLLTGISHECDDLGEPRNILSMLQNTNMNMMEIINSPIFSYMEQIKAINRDQTSELTTELNYDLVDELYVSPAVKRGIWRALRIVDEIIGIIGHPPNKFFIETTRSEDTENKGKKIPSRKAALIELFKNCKNQEYEWFREHGWSEEIERSDERELRGRSLYLYYTQLGRCMYCGERLDLNSINNPMVCDRDHIYPQSKTTDDSVHNNLVLCCHICNQNKSDRYPLSLDIQTKMRQHWKYLKENGFITPTKYERLMRTKEFSEDELSGFISRQLVETSQSTKAVAKILEKLYKDNPNLSEKSDIIYVKAENVNRFRHENGFQLFANGKLRDNKEDRDSDLKVLEFVKCREVNDYHHAKDAYLNVVVGNIFDIMFSSNPILFIRSKEGQSYNIKLEKMLKRNISRKGVTAWVAGSDGTMKTVMKHMQRNDILFTRMQIVKKGEFYNQLAVKPKSKLNPIKGGRDPLKYGGYDSENPAYLSLVEYSKGKKRERTLQVVPIHIAKGDSTDRILEYFREKGLSDPKIIRQIIRINSLFELNGFKIHLRGGKDYMNAEQLVLSDETYNYCKKVTKYLENVREKRWPPTRTDELSSEKNYSAFSELVSKFDGHYDTSFYRPLKEQLSASAERFRGESIEVQAKIIGEILKVFQCNPSRGDFSKIGCTAEGRITISNIMNNDPVMINQSITGIFENRFNLNKDK